MAMDRRLRSCLMPSFMISRFLCFTPYDEDGNVKRKRVLLSFLINSAILSVMVRGFWIEMTTYERHGVPRKPLKYARRLTHITSTAAAVCSQTYWFIFKPSLLKSVSIRIYSLSKSLRNTTNYTRINWLTGIITGILAIAATFVSFLLRPSRWHLAVVMYFIPHIYHVLVIMQITALLEAVRCLFQRLNEEVKGAEDLYKCTQIHAVLCSVVKDVNRMYSCLLFFTVTDLLIHVTTQVYDLFRAIADSKPPGSEPALVFLSARLIFIWSVCYCATEVCWECEAFFRHMVEAMRVRCYPCYDPTLTLYAGVKPSVYITAAGVFNITNHIITSIIATGTTYFIVLIQLE